MTSECLRNPIPVPKRPRPIQPPPPLAAASLRRALFGDFSPPCTAYISPTTRPNARPSPSALCVSLPSPVPAFRRCTCPPHLLTLAPPPGPRHHRPHHHPPHPPLPLRSRLAPHRRPVLLHPSPQHHRHRGPGARGPSLPPLHMERSVVLHNVVARSR